MEQKGLAPNPRVFLALTGFLDGGFEIEILLSFSTQNFTHILEERFSGRIFFKFR